MIAKLDYLQESTSAGSVLRNGGIKPGFRISIETVMLSIALKKY